MRMDPYIARIIELSISLFMTSKDGVHYEFSVDGVVDIFKAICDDSILPSGVKPKLRHPDGWTTYVNGHVLTAYKRCAAKATR